MDKSTKITLNDVLLFEKSRDINEELQFFCSSLGLFSLRDKDKSCYRIFATLLRSGGLSSDEIANMLNLSRGTVIHHINKLAEMKIIDSNSAKYFIKGDNLKDIVKDIEKETSKIIDVLKNKAKDLDEKLNL